MSGAGTVRIVTLHQTGTEWTAICPFHGGLKPDLVADVVRGCFECSCGAKGGIHLHYMTSNGDMIARIERVV